MFKFNKFLIALAFVGLSASAVNAQTTSGSCGDNLTWQLTGTGDNLTLTISGTGAMTDYDYNNPASWYSQRENIKTLVLENGMTTIGERAFFDCSSLTGNLTIPSGVITIGNAAFYQCSGFTGNLTIPNSVTTIEQAAFYWCSGFTGTLTIPNSVTTIGNQAFDNCSGFTGTLIIPSSVADIGGAAFRSCSSLTSIDVNPSNSAYSSIDGVLFNKVQDVLLQCPAGKQGTYIIPSGVTSIGGSAFAGCNGLTGTLTIPSGVTSIGFTAFAYCSGFTGNLTIPSGFTTIPHQAFCGCSGLSSVTIPNSVTSIGSYAFYDCSGLTGTLIIPNSVTSIENAAFQQCSLLSSVTIGNNVTSIGDWAFAYCSGLTDVHVNWATPLVINSNVFNDLILSGIELYVPSGTKCLYGNASVWGNFDIIGTLPTISATAGNNGNISPSGTTEPITCGENKTYTFTANSGYEIDTVLIDNVPNATAKENGEHTFENVTANHTISVTFKATVGIADISANSISIYPNPTQNKLTIDGGDLQINNVEICDLAGRVVFGQPQGSPLQINISALPAGIYLVKIHTDKGIVTRKVVKN